MARGPHSTHLRSWRPSRSNRPITGSDRVLATPQGTLRFQVQGHTITSSLRGMRASANQLASRQPMMKLSESMREPLLAQANINLTSTSALRHLRERNSGLSSVTGRRRSDNLAQGLTTRLIVSSRSQLKHGAWVWRSRGQVRVRPKPKCLVPAPTTPQSSLWHLPLRLTE